MGDNFSDPITIRLAKGSRRKIVALAEKNGTTTAGVLRQIVDEYLAGNDLEHRLRIAHEEALSRTLERVVSSVEQGMVFAVGKIAGGEGLGANLQSPMPSADDWSPSDLYAPERKDATVHKSSGGGPGRYNLTLLMAGSYDDQITEDMEKEADRRYGMRYPNDTATDRAKFARLILEVLNEGWKPAGSWDRPMRIPG